ncbi:sorting nexin-31 [Discoglossus pictus]
MHISIPVTEEVPDGYGGRFVLYSVHLEGFLLFKVRYNDLHLWDEKIHRVFGNRLSAFPPKYYLAMTKYMAEERRIQLEHYLQQLVSDPMVSNSEIFIECFKKLQLETYKMPTVKIILRLYLPDSKNVEVDVQTSDTAERVLEVALYKLGVSRELMEYFSLFLTHKETDGTYTVVKIIASFELPFITIWSIDNDEFQIDIRKWYMNPSTDEMLMGCTAAINLLYLQAQQEIEINWARLTEEQRQKLQHLIKTENKIKVLEMMQEVQDYGCMQFAPCSCDFPEPDTTVTLSVGNSQMTCSFRLPNGQTQNLRLHIHSMTQWHVKLLKSEKAASVSAPDRLVFMFEYRQSDSLAWMSIRTPQAFLLSSCLKKILNEQPVICTKEELEMVEKPFPRKSISNLAEVGFKVKNKTVLKNTQENASFDRFRDDDL